MNELPKFLGSNRFVSALLGTLFVIAANHGYITQADATTLAAFCATFIAVRTIDKRGELSSGNTTNLQTNNVEVTQEEFKI